MIESGGDSLFIRMRFILVVFFRITAGGFYSEQRKKIKLQHTYVGATVRHVYSACTPQSWDGCVKRSRVVYY
jgi:hypothetical protein